jgi:phenylpyruvate tautomerase PptA (4-oxalocrotonate tautomerase family)
VEEARATDPDDNQKSALVEELTLAFFRICESICERIAVIIDEVLKLSLRFSYRF